jgi:hypothetical protein
VTIPRGLTDVDWQLWQLRHPQIVKNKKSVDTLLSFHVEAAFHIQIPLITIHEKEIHFTIRVF